MAVITGDFPPGPYQGTYDASSIGLMEGPVRHQQTSYGLPIRAALWGQQILDYIIQGGGVFVVVVLKEWNTATKLVMHPQNAAHGIFMESGKLYSTFAKPLVLTALPGSPAATEGPATRTYPYTAVMPGHNIDVSMGPVERNVAVVLVAFPEQDSTNTGRSKYFTDS